MRRTGFDERQDVQTADRFLADYMACRKCGASTDRRTLGELGGQCNGCFAAYCAAANSKRPTPTQAQRRALAASLLGARS